MCLYDELRPGEEVTAVVTMAAVVGYDAEGCEYRRTIKLVSPDATRGETRGLLEEGRLMLAKRVSESGRRH